MSDQFRFCALGALYDGDKVEYVHKCLESISNQTTSIPIYIVIDGPIGHDLETKLKEFERLGIKYIRLEKNLGLARALSYAVNRLIGNYDYVIRFDSDDVNMPNRFEILCAYINKNEPDLVSTHMYEMDENDEIFSERRVPIGRNNIRKNLPYRNPINHPAAAFKLNSVMEVGNYQEMPFFEDWYLWIRMFKKGYTIENIDDFLVNFRATDAMVARRYGLAYVKHEKNFFLRRRQENLISPITNLIAFLLRIGVKVLGFEIYKKIFYWIRK